MDRSFPPTKVEHNAHKCKVNDVWTKEKCLMVSALIDMFSIQLSELTGWNRQFICRFLNLVFLTGNGVYSTVRRPWSLLLRVVEFRAYLEGETKFSFSDYLRSCKEKYPEDGEELKNKKRWRGKIALMLHTGNPSPRQRDILEKSTGR